MGRDREGCMGCAVAAQAGLYLARTRLEPRRQPRDERHDKAALARGASGRRRGGVSVAPAQTGATVGLAQRFQRSPPPRGRRAIALPPIGQAAWRERVVQDVLIMEG